MIDYKDGGLMDILPVNLRSHETESIGYALDKAKGKLLEYMAACSVYGDLNSLPDHILDLIAMELGTRYYDQAMDTELKRQLITQTYIWYLHAGTPSVLEAFLATVFDGGHVLEWFSYGGNPYCFQVEVAVNECPIKPEDDKRIRRQVEACKNARSWLEHIWYKVWTCYGIPIAISSSLSIQSEFYPRYNLGHLCLDGTWCLDGTYRLNGYKDESFIDFYPMQIGCITGIGWGGIATDANCSILSSLEGDVVSGTGITMAADTTEPVGTESNLLASDCIEAGPTIDVTLTVEKDLWYLDGTYALDGEKLLDAQIFIREL